MSVMYNHTMSESWFRVFHIVVTVFFALLMQMQSQIRGLEQYNRMLDTALTQADLQIDCDEEERLGLPASSTPCSNVK